MATLAKGTKRANSLFERHLPIIEAIIARRCWSEEKRQNALCWAWQLFLRYLPTADSPKHAAVSAAIYASRKRRTFGRPPRCGYVDAIDMALHVDADAIQERIDEIRRLPKWAIEQMPPRLQMVALPLANGVNRKRTAELTSLSHTTVWRIVDEIADWILERHPMGRRAA